MPIYFGDSSGGGDTVEGRIIQIQRITKTDTFSSNSDSFTDLTGMNVNITPHHSGNKILIIASICYGQSADSYASGRLVRYRADVGTVGIGVAPSASYRTLCGFSLQGELYNGNNKLFSQTYTYLDEPGTTVQLTYKLQGRTYSGDSRSFCINRTLSDANASYLHRGESRIMALEVAA